MKPLLGLVATILCVFLGPLEAGAKDDVVDHSAWHGLLTHYVRDGLVDYAGLKLATPALEGYLATLRRTIPSRLRARQDQLAFWINAYNACVVAGVVKRYPLASVRSVSGFFDRLRYDVGGRALTLNDIEAEGRKLGDWRLHMALVCASSSCPPLRAEAYVPERLDDQLADQTRQFLRDPQRGLRVEGGTMWVSKIFKWYVGDFLPGGQLIPARLVAVLEPYLDPDAAATIRQRPTLGLKLLDYDWSLNRVPAGGAETPP